MSNASTRPLCAFQQVVKLHHGPRALQRQARWLVSSLILREGTAGSVVLSGRQYGGHRTPLWSPPGLHGNTDGGMNWTCSQPQGQAPVFCAACLFHLGEGAWPTARWDVAACRRLWPGRAGLAPRAVPGKHCHPRKPHVLWLFQNPGNREQHAQVPERGPVPAHAVKDRGQAATAAEFGVRAGGHSTAALPHVPHTNH